MVVHRPSHKIIELLNNSRLNGSAVNAAYDLPITQHDFHLFHSLVKVGWYEGAVPLLCHGE